jgi:RimJ/RimL family protein N-acetyltransferase
MGKSLAKEFTDPSIYHKTFAWDSETLGDYSEFTQNGYRADHNVTLTARAEDIQKPKKYFENLEIIEPSKSDEWEQVIQIQIETGEASNMNREKPLSRDEWERFYRHQISRYQKLIARGQGLWFCARVRGEIVGSLGIFMDTPGTIRYQIVSTKPSYQRRGICGTLVHAAALYALQNLKAETLVMVADGEYHAAKVYESVGFKPTEKLYGLAKY